MNLNISAQDDRSSLEQNCSLEIIIKLQHIILDIEVFLSVWITKIECGSWH